MSEKTGVHSLSELRGGWELTLGAGLIKGDWCQFASPVAGPPGNWGTQAPLGGVDWR
ncbi:MAG: hypothetical protein AAFR26_25350 [Cyanobacteria bacterium J06626_4]